MKLRIDAALDEVEDDLQAELSDLSERLARLQFEYMQFRGQLDRGKHGLAEAIRRGMPRRAGDAIEEDAWKRVIQNLDVIYELQWPS